MKEVVSLNYEAKTGGFWELGEPGDHRIEAIATRGDVVHTWTTYRAGGAIRRWPR